MIVRGVNAVSGGVGKLDLAEGEHHLPDRGRVADAGPADLRHALDAGGAVGEVDGHRVVLARHREGRGLAGQPDELLQVRPREPAQVEAPEDGVAELEQPQREPVAARLGHVLDVPRRGERREQARDGARVDAGAAGDLVRAELVAVGERVEHPEGALDRGDVPDGWLTGAGRGTLLLSDFDTPLPGRQ